MMKKLSYLLLILALACAEKPVEEVPAEVNPAAEGFNMDRSDPKAVAIADDVMMAMGGRKQWDDTQIICWNFFGSRQLIWDKHSGNVRIDSKRDTSVYLINIFDNTGRVQQLSLIHI